MRELECYPSLIKSDLSFKPGDREAALVLFELVLQDRMQQIEGLAPNTMLTAACPACVYGSS